jgi:multicomponent Na+:H+ antiporter subunit E
LLLTGFWLLLVGGDVTSLVIGVVFIPMSIFVSHKLSEKAGGDPNDFRIQVIKIPKFIVFFLYQSIKGGMGTAQRVFSSNMNLKPEFIHYPIKFLPAGLPMNLFMNLVSLLPGSVSVIREPDRVLVHVLALTPTSLNEIYECECIIGELFGLATPSASHKPLTEKAL